MNHNHRGEALGADSASEKERAQGIRFAVATLISPLHGARNALKRKPPYSLFRFELRFDDSWMVGNPSLSDKVRHYSCSSSFIMSGS
jgi:hypothetical protein